MLRVGLRQPDLALHRKLASCSRFDASLFRYWFYSCSDWTQRSKPGCRLARLLALHDTWADWTIGHPFLLHRHRTQPLIPGDTQIGFEAGVREFSPPTALCRQAETSCIP